MSPLRTELSCGIPGEVLLKFPSNAAIFGGEPLGNVLPEIKGSMTESTGTAWSSFVGRAKYLVEDCLATTPSGEVKVSDSTGGDLS